MSVLFLALVLALALVRSQVRVPVPVLWMAPDTGPDSRRDRNRTLALIPALTLALEDLRKHPGLLRNHELQLHTLDSQCLGCPPVPQTLKSLFELKWAGLEPLLLLGGACPVTSSLSLVIPALHLVQVSFLAPPPLSNRKRSSHMVSMLPSDWAFNRAVVKLLQRLDWTRVGLVSEKTPRISQALRDLLRQLDQAQVQVLSSVRFSGDACSALRQLKERDVRIFIAQMEEDSASELFCCAYRLNLLGPRVQWLLLGAAGGSTLGWTRSHCSTQSLLSAADGAIQVQVQGLRFNQGPGVSGRTAEQYEHLYLRHLSSSGLKVAPLHGFLYDAVWLTALALDRVLDRTEILDPNQTSRTSPDPELRDEFLRTLKTTHFTGVTGPVQLRGGERIMTLEVTQFKGSSSVSVGEFNTSDQSLTLDLHLLQFKGGRPPRDRTLVRTETRHVTLVLYVVTATASSIIVLLSLGIVCVCVCHRRHRLELWRSVPQEEMLCLGLILCCVSVMVSGLDQVPVSDQARTVFCSAHLWTLCLGHSVLFSVLFTEAWILYSLCHRLPKSHLQSPWRLLFWLLLLDMFVLTSWTVMDPLKERPLQLVRAEEDVWVQSVSRLCVSSHSELWVTAVCGYKGPLLGLGLFVVWSLGPGPELGPGLVVISLKSGLSALSLFSALVVLAYTSHDALLRFSLSSAFVLSGCISVLAAAFGPKLFVTGSEGSGAQTEAEQEQKKRNRELRTRSLQLELEIDQLRRELFHPGSTSNEQEGRTAESPGRTQESPGRTQESPGRTQESPGRPQESPGRPQERPGRPQESLGRPQERPGRPQVSVVRSVQQQERTQDAAAGQC